MDIIGPILYSMEKSPLSIKKENEDNKKGNFKAQSPNESFRCQNSYKQNKGSNTKSSDKQERSREEKSTGSNIINRSFSFTSYNVKIESDVNLNKSDSDTISNNLQVVNASSDQELNTSETFKPLYKCQTCGKIYNVRKQFVNHKNNHKRNKKTGRHAFAKKMPTENSEFSTNQLEKNLTVKDTSINVNDNEQSCNPNQQDKSVDINNSKTSQSKTTVQNEQLTYKCKICDRTFTKKKTFLNHKSNHIHNRNTAKFLFFQRSNEKVI